MSRGGLGVESSSECWCLIPCNIMADTNSDVVEWQSHPRNIRLIENECHLQINPGYATLTTGAMVASG